MAARPERTEVEHFGLNLSPPTARYVAGRCVSVFFRIRKKVRLTPPLHPLIQQETQRQFQQATTSPMCYGVAPLLVENGGCIVPTVCTVLTTPETQLMRNNAVCDDVTREHVATLLPAAQAT